MRGLHVGILVTAALHGLSQENVEFVLFVLVEGGLVGQGVFVDPLLGRFVLHRCVDSVRTVFVTRARTRTVELLIRIIVCQESAHDFELQVFDDFVFDIGIGPEIVVDAFTVFVRNDVDRVYPEILRRVDRGIDPLVDQVVVADRHERTVAPYVGQQVGAARVVGLRRRVAGLQDTRIVCRRLYVPFLGEAVVDRGAALIAAVIRIFDDAVLIEHGKRRAESRGAVAARQIDRVLLYGSRSEDLILPVDALYVAVILDRAAFAQIGFVEVGLGHDLLLERDELVGIHQVDFLGYLGKSPACVESHLRCSGSAQFGGDDHHAVGGAGAVYRGC